MWHFSVGRKIKTKYSRKRSFIAFGVFVVHLKFLVFSLFLSCPYEFASPLLFVWYLIFCINRNVSFLLNKLGWASTATFNHTQTYSDLMSQWFCSFCFKILKNESKVSFQWFVVAIRTIFGLLNEIDYEKQREINPNLEHSEPVTKFLCSCFRSRFLIWISKLFFLSQKQKIIWITFLSNPNYSSISYFSNNFSLLFAFSFEFCD